MLDTFFSLTLDCFFKSFAKQIFVINANIVFKYLIYFTNLVLKQL